LSAIGSLARVSEIDELAARIEALEAAHAKKGAPHE
jgi:BMFP domain-containing protein YqiC